MLTLPQGLEDNLIPISDKDSWATITREERFFTCMLFHDIHQNPKPFWELLRSRLGYGDGVQVEDSGYEVCFFRDAAQPGVDQIERQPHLEKQTFDLALWLSNQGFVIIEAKAQQGFEIEQMEKLQEARNIMRASEKWDRKEICLVGLYSSKYSPKPTTRNYFDALVRWNEIAEVYPKNKQIYQRADDIYGK